MTELFVLKEKQRLPQEAAPTQGEYYDEDRQLWVDAESGESVILREKRSVASSTFGETTSTATREGIDQSEVVGLNSSKFGETSLTETAEGADQSELSVFSSSRFGETSMTKTIEGADCSELAAALGRR